MNRPFNDTNSNAAPNKWLLLFSSDALQLGNHLLQQGDILAPSLPLLADQAQIAGGDLRRLRKEEINHHPDFAIIDLHDIGFQRFECIQPGLASLGKALFHDFGIRHPIPKGVDFGMADVGIVFEELIKGAVVGRSAGFPESCLFTPIQLLFGSHSRMRNLT